MLASQSPIHRYSSTKVRVVLMKLCLDGITIITSSELICMLGIIVSPNQFSVKMPAQTCFVCIIVEDVSRLSVGWSVQHVVFQYGQKICYRIFSWPML